MGISTEDARPEWMMITVLPVPPPQVRPAISIDGGALRGEDDLTYKLIEIIRTNQALKRYESEGAPAHILAECETLLQVRSYIYQVVKYCSPRLSFSIHVTVACGDVHG